MNNCLVSKLKGSVNNDMLPVLNCIRFTKRESNQSRLIFKANNAVHQSDFSISITAYGGLSVVYDRTYTNETFNVPISDQASTILLVNSDGNFGYMDVHFPSNILETMIERKVTISTDYLGIDKSVDALLLYSPYFITNIYRYGTKCLGNNNKLSTLWEAIEDDADLALFVITINQYKTEGFVWDGITIERVGKLINASEFAPPQDYTFDGIEEANAVAQEMVDNGRNSGTFYLTTKEKTYEITFNNGTYTIVNP